MAWSFYFCQVNIALKLNLSCNFYQKLCILFFKARWLAALISFYSTIQVMVIKPFNWVFCTSHFICYILYFCILKAAFIFLYLHFVCCLSCFLFGVKFLCFVFCISSCVFLRLYFVVRETQWLAAFISPLYPTIPIIIIYLTTLSNPRNHCCTLHNTKYKVQNTKKKEKNTKYKKSDYHHLFPNPL